MAGGLIFGLAILLMPLRGWGATATASATESARTADAPPEVEAPVAAWARLAPATNPPARLHAAMAYDPLDRTTVLFGGRAGNEVLGDTWVFDGTTWTRKTPAASPPPLESASMAYDQASRQLILFGGEGGGGPIAGTWNWDGATWIPLSPAGTPLARYGAALSYNDAAHTLVLFGGFTSPTTTLGDTWTWDGNSWSVRLPGASPPARGGASLAFDAVHGTSVLFGGSTGGAPLGDTWTWDGTAWSQQHPATSPGPRLDPAAASDPVLPGTVLFGGTAPTAPTTPGAPTATSAPTAPPSSPTTAPGSTGTAGTAAGTAAPGTAAGAPGRTAPAVAVRTDTWWWDGDNWTELASSGGPAARSGAAEAFDLGGHQLLLFGGTGSDGAPLNDLWSLKGGLAPGTPGSSTTGSRPAPGRAGPKASPPSSAPPITSTPGSLAARKPLKPGSSLLVVAHSVRDGDQVTLSGAGFAPHTTVVVSFHSTPVVVGSTTADRNGAFLLTVSVPADAAAGQHHFEAVGSGPSGLQTTLIAAVRVTSLTPHHSWVIPAVMIIVTLLISAAAWAATTIFPRQGWLRARP